MNRRLKILIASAIVLLAANIIKLSVFPQSKRNISGSSYDKSKLSMNYQEPGSKEQAKVQRELFDGDAGTYKPPVLAAAPQYTPAPAPTQEEKWPDFRISGVADNDEKKCAFFSGPAFSGAVYEGTEIMPGYTLTGIFDGYAEIIRSSDGKKLNINLEGK